MIGEVLSYAVRLLERCKREGRPMPRVKVVHPTYAAILEEWERCQEEFAARAAAAAEEKAAKRACKSLTRCD
jgi:hypothetical protein